MVFTMFGLFTNMRIINNFKFTLVTDASHSTGFDDPNNIG
jgi:hypothetical protein